MCIIVYCHDSHVDCTFWISLIWKFSCCYAVYGYHTDCLLCIQATVFLKYLPNWTTWIVLVAISLYGSCAFFTCTCTCTCHFSYTFMYMYISWSHLIRTCTCSTTLLLIYMPFFHYRPVCTSSTCRSLCCSLSQGSSENSGGDCQRERHEHISFSHLLL